VTGVADQQPRRRGTDWIAARDFWLALPHPRSSQPVADKFRVSRTRVNHVRKRDSWDAIAAEIDAKALDVVKRREIKNHAQRDEDLLGLYDKLIDRAHEMLDRDDAAEVKFSDIPPYVRQVQLVQGEPTDRIAQAEVQDGMRVLVETSVPFVPKADRAAWLEALRRALGWEGEADAA
jgi:hypothetical protein